MGKIVEWAQGFALAMGAPGLFVVAILDSSILTLPEINDILVVLLVTRHKARLALYAGAATAGSIVGSLVLFMIGRKGGEAVLEKRFSVERSNRARAFIQKYGVMAIIIPSLLPPPMPFKMFVLLSGVARLPVEPLHHGRRDRARHALLRRGAAGASLRGSDDGVSPRAQLDGGARPGDRARRGARRLRPRQQSKRRERPLKYPGND